MAGRRTAVPANTWYVLVILCDGWHIGLHGGVFGDEPGSAVPPDGAGNLLVFIGR